MTHAQKINYMRIASGVAGIVATNECLDLLVSIYDLIIEKGGKADVRMLAKIQVEVEERHNPNKTDLA